MPQLEQDIASGSPSLQRQSAEKQLCRSNRAESFQD